MKHIPLMSCLAHSLLSWNTANSDHQFVQGFYSFTGLPLATTNQYTAIYRWSISNGLCRTVCHCHRSGRKCRSIAFCFSVIFITTDLISPFGEMAWASQKTHWLQCRRLSVDSRLRRVVKPNGAVRVTRYSTCTMQFDEPFAGGDSGWRKEGRKEQESWKLAQVMN